MNNMGLHTVKLLTRWFFGIINIMVLLCLAMVKKLRSKILSTKYWLSNR